MISKKQKKRFIYMFMIIYTYIFLKGEVFGADKSLFKVDVPSAVVIEAETGRVLYEQNAKDERAMASLTKIMTCIILIENSNLDDIVTAPNEVNWMGGSVMGLKGGDKLTAHDLLVGMLLPSGNDAAYTAAIYVGGDIENFANMMTNKAKQIGAFNTSFKNPHGLDVEGHYSTAYDLALIMRYALKYDVINDIISSKSKDVKINGNIVTLNNTNALLKSNKLVDGGKTGFTNNAERCLICTATKDGMRTITVVLGANSTELRFNTAENLFTKCFEIYSKKDISNLMNFKIELPVIKGEEEKYVIDVNENAWYPLSEEELKNVYIKQDIVENLNGGDLKGKYLGRIQLMIDDEVILKKDYILEHDIAKKSVKSYFGELIDLFV